MKKLLITLICIVVFFPAHSQFIVTAKGGIGYNNFINGMRLFNSYNTQSSNRYFFPYGVDLKLRKYKTLNPGLSIEFQNRSFGVTVDQSEFNFNLNNYHNESVYTLNQLAVCLFPELLVGANVKYHFSLGACIGIKLNSTRVTTGYLIDDNNVVTSLNGVEGNGNYLTDVTLAARLGTGADIPVYKNLYITLDVNAFLGSHGFNTTIQNTTMAYSFYTTLGVSWLFGKTSEPKIRTEENPSVLHP